MGQSISIGCTLLDGKDYGISIISSRNDPPPTHTIKKEIGLLSVHTTHDSHKEQQNINIDQLQNKAKDIACTKCSDLGGNAFLATQLQTILLSPNHRKECVVQLIGTCVKLQRKDGNTEEAMESGGLGSHYEKITLQ